MNTYCISRRGQAPNIRSIITRVFLILFAIILFGSVAADARSKNKGCRWQPTTTPTPYPTPKPTPKPTPTPTPTPTPIPNMLSAEWLFDNQDGTDTSGNGNTIVFSNTTFSNAPGESCSSYGLAFNGTNSIATATNGSGLNNNQSFTFDFCAYPDGSYGQQYSRIASRETSAGLDDFYIDTRSGTSNFGVVVFNTSGQAFETLTAANTFPVNVRNCVRIQYN